MGLLKDLSEKKVYTNWAGNIRFTPAELHVPQDERSIVKLVEKATFEKRTIKTLGSRHSCSSIFKTEDILLSMEKFNRFRGCDHEKREAVVDAAMTIEEVGNALFNNGFAMENIGHIDQQAIAGAICTGTHGAGKGFTNLSGQAIGVRLVTGTQEIKSFSHDADPEMMQALRVSLGALGIFTNITLKVLANYKVHHQYFCTSVSACIKNLPYLVDNNRNFGFYWYPRRDDVSLRLWNIPGGGVSNLPFAELKQEKTGWSKDLLPSPQELRYKELEYSIRAEHAPDCFLEIRERIKSKHRKVVGWRVLYRPVAADDTYLSNAYGYDTVAMTVHQNANLPHQEYFNDIENIFQTYGGRPHWGKIHSMKAAQLKKCYPMWDRFHEIRRQLDPNGIFMNDYLRRVFLED